MPGPGELIALMELEREQEQQVAASLTAAERETDGTLEQPSVKDRFAHAVGAKWHMHDALIAHQNGQEPHPAHDREAIFRANAGRPFGELENDAARVAEALVADVRALDATRLAAAPPWIHEATLADEVIQQCGTHGMVLMLEVMCERGEADDARRAQVAFVEALPADTSPLQRSRALYNLACLAVRCGRENDAAVALADALRLRPALVEHVRDDPDLAPLRR
ncbi:MAG TPA: hypothetical protein VHS27_19180 [Gaiellales bacterium]|jgi:hypothetical protein|nr:hypothetical protein [Gaiellales bacterium]